MVNFTPSWLIKDISVALTIPEIDNENTLYITFFKYCWNILTLYIMTVSIYYGWVFSNGSNGEVLIQYSMIECWNRSFYFPATLHVVQIINFLLPMQY